VTNLVGDRVLEGDNCGWWKSGGGCQSWLV